MPWLKSGDNAATHPRLMRLATLGDERTLNEVCGFALRCAWQSAGHMTDYVIDEGTAALMGGARTKELLRLAERAGLMRRDKLDGQRAWRLLEDPEFFHMRLRSEVEADRQRDRDRKNLDLTMPVLARDGDQCRYCGVVVNWFDRKGNRGGTFDHREPGQPATVDTYVVACRACNRTRWDDPDADERLPLRPAPGAPYYSRKTAERLTKHYGRPFPTADSRPVSQADTAHTRPGSRPDNATSTTRREPAASGPPQPSTTTARPASQADTAARRDPDPGTPQPPARPAPADTAQHARDDPEVPPPQARPPGYPGSTSDPRGGSRDGTGVGWVGSVPSHAPAPAGHPPDPSTRPARGRRGTRSRRSRGDV